MATYFAEVINDKVIRVIVADQDFINSGKVGDPKNWVETFMDGSKRDNYAGIGDTYDEIADAFITEKKSPLWILNTATYRWIVPEQVVSSVLSGSEVI